ncbi:hypothetical protein, partial [Providencia alcalifaciens]|uniref:hypothetical protein n=1 Tax=Providencia alcalifaciens TaxID=126385 RepID=UPI002B05643C
TRMIFERDGYNYVKRQINLKLYFLGAWLPFFVLSFFLHLMLRNFIYSSLFVGFFASGIVCFLIWRLKISKYLKSVEDYLDGLLSQYIPNDKAAFDKLIEKVKDCPYEFLPLVCEWVEFEEETYKKRELIKKEYNFTK